MRPASHGKYETRLIGAPQNWDRDRDGECGALSICDLPDDRGHNRMVSRWELEDGELEKLQAGAPIFLSVLGQVHPVVCVYIGDPPSPEATEVDDA